MLDKLKAAAASAKAKVSEVAGSITEGGAEKARLAVEEVTTGFAVLREKGVSFEEMEVKISLIPSITIGVYRSSSVSMAELEEFKATHQDKKYLSALVTGILTAERLAPSMTVRGQRLTGYKVELSIPPSLSLVYKPILAVTEPDVSGDAVPTVPLLAADSVS